MKVLLFAIILFLSSLSFSQNWTGAISSDWNNSANWSEWPLGGQDVTIDPINYSGVAASPIISSNSVFSPAFVLVTNGGQLTINADLTTGDNVECIGLGSSIEVNAGTINVNPGDGGRLIFDLGATGTINAGNVFVDERFIAGENALVTINGGTSTSGERLLMDLGGHFVQEGGTVNVAAVFAMADGSTTQNSGYTLNNGNLNITGEFAIECEAGNFEPFFIQNDGVLTVNGDMFWLGVTPGTGRGYFIQNGGISYVSGIIQNMPTSTTGMHFILNNSAVCNLTGTLFENLHLTDSLIQTGTSQLNILQPNHTIINKGVINGLSGLLSIDGNCSVTGNGSFQLPNVDLFANSSLNHTTLSPISINGDFLTDGNYIHQNHKLILNGSNLQNVGGSNSLLTYKLTIDNSDQGVLLGANIIVDDSLILLNGVLQSSLLDIVTVTENGMTSTGSNQSHISGPIEKIGNTAFIFPVGKNGKWARIGISAPSAINDVFLVEYFDNSFSSLSPVNSPLSGVSGIEYWNLEQTNGTANVQVELFWEDAASSAITDCNELSIANWDGSAWTNKLSTSSGSCVANNSGSIQSNSTVNTYGNFTFGFYSGVTSQQFEICSGSTISVGSSIYDSTGTYIDILQDINNNDSIVVTSLTVVSVNPSVQYTAPEFVAIDPTADSYDWIDCYSENSIGVNTVNFTPTSAGWYAMVAITNACADTSECFYINFIDTTICQGESVSIGTNSYSSQGVYYEELYSSINQDSIVKLSLTVNLVDTTIFLASNSIISNNTNATSFQWYDCNTSLNLLNENSSIFNFTSNGSYGLIVEENGCIDTSSCITILNVGLNDLNFKQIYFYPNPTKGVITFLGVINPVMYNVYNVLGHKVQNGKIYHDQVVELHLNQGNYIIELKDIFGTITMEKLVIY